MEKSGSPDEDEVLPTDSERLPFRERAFTMLPPPNYTATDSYLGQYIYLIAPRDQADIMLARGKVAATVNEWCQPKESMPPAELVPTPEIEKIRAHLQRRYQQLVSRLQIGTTHELQWPPWTSVAAILTEDVMQHVGRSFKEPIIVPIPPIQTKDLASMIDKNLKRYNNSKLHRVYFDANKLANPNLYHVPTNHNSRQQWQIIIVEDPGVQNRVPPPTNTTIHNTIVALAKTYEAQGLQMVSGIKQYIMLSLARLLLHGRPMNDDDNSWTVLNPYIAAANPKAPVGLGETRDKEITFSFAHPTVIDRSMQLIPSLNLLVPKAKSSTEPLW